MVVQGESGAFMGKESLYFRPILDLGFMGVLAPEAPLIIMQGLERSLDKKSTIFEMWLHRLILLILRPLE